MKKQKMKAEVETSDKQLIALLQPLIAAVTLFEGHINYSYSKRHMNQDYTCADVQHKQNLMNQLRPMLQPDWIIGCGSGHIYISHVTRSCNDRSSWSYKQPEAGPTDRILFITDND